MMMLARWRMASRSSREKLGRSERSSYPPW